MITKHQAHPSPTTRGTTRSSDTHEDGTLSRTLLVRAAIGGAFLLVAMSVSLLLASCGQSTDRSSGSGNAEAAQVAESPTPIGTAATASRSGEIPASQLPVTAQAESLPPDIAVTVTDRDVVPGENVEILVQSTVDVIEIALWDGLHDRQAFTYDGDAKAWRTIYRVPMRPTSDRIGLSVTAKNDANRWRRSWVFLRVGSEPPETSVEPDSTR